jgi:hypothetical protein
MLWRHFRDLHPFNKVVVSTEGYFPWCEWCAMQVNPAYPRHIRTQECQTGVDRKLQRESVVCSALALRRQFLVHGHVLERIEIYRYLGCLLAQDLGCAFRFFSVPDWPHFLESSDFRGLLRVPRNTRRN